MHRIFLSPHFDDAVFSCGGLLWQQSQTGAQVEIWTICGGEIPPGELSPYAQEHHTRWGTGGEAVSRRAQEDARACELVGAACRRFPIPDCIYRRAGEDYLGSLVGDPPLRARSGHHLYGRYAELFGEVHPLEAVLVRQLAQVLSRSLPPQAELIAPLAVGGHVDHRLTRAAAEACGSSLWFYADIPYALQPLPASGESSVIGWESILYEINSQALAMWCAAIAAHTSQISTFWGDLSEMQRAVHRYVEQNGGLRLWRPAPG